MTLQEFSQNLKGKTEKGVTIITTNNFIETVQEIYNTGARLALMFAEIKKDKSVIHYLFDQKEAIVELKQDVKNDTYLTIYNIYFSSLFFENEIMDMFGFKALGNEKLSRLTLHENIALDIHPLNKEFKYDTNLEWANIPKEFLKVEGRGVFEIPVGPIHAGVIEPGHFRFSLAGERIINIQPMLWFQHKGTEKLFENINPENYIKLAERISGDTSISHTLAHIQAVEKILSVEVPIRAQLLRTILSELERIYNHVNDIGFIGQDTGFGPAGSQGMRLKELVLRQNEKLTKSRMLRNVLCYGGVSFNLEQAQIEALSLFIQKFKKDYSNVIKMNEDISTMTSRMETCGILKHSVAVDYATVGYPARASGVNTDTRVYHPYDGYKTIVTNISVFKSGDVKARYFVRVKEVIESLRIIELAIENLKKGPVNVKVNIKKATGSAYGITEGWRGEIIHYIAMDDGKITRAKIKDPSFSNWQAMVPTINGNIIGDFPLINKSFNLSYSGNDL